MITLAEIESRLISARIEDRQNFSGLTPAAVLIPLFHREGRLHVLFTERTEWVESHKGEVSFPGGMYEEQDGSYLQTALRESREEIGLLPRDVNVLGRLSAFPTVTGFLVHPFVGYFPYPYNFQINGSEVASLLQVPMDFLVAPENLRYMKRTYRGKEYLLEYYLWEGRKIWGATSRILINFLRTINLLR